MDTQGIRRRFRSIAGIGTLPLVAALVVAPMLALGPGKAAADFAAPTFRSTIVINDNGPASPYSSTVTVGGLRGNVVDVNVILNNFSHDRPEDVAVMLAYRGRAATLMRGAGGTAAVRNANILLNDEATEALPDTLPLAGGTAYRPVDYTRIPVTPIGEPFGGLAPDPNDVAGEYLDFFDGLTPNGEWTLWVRDDRANFFGSMSGWTLEIVTDVPAGGFIARDKFRTERGRTLSVGADGGVLRNVDLRGDQEFIAKVVQRPTKGRLTLRTDGSFTYVPERNKRGADSFTYRIEDEFGSSIGGTGTVRIRISGDGVRR